jgi:hypothetical protein
MMRRPAALVALALAVAPAAAAADVVLSARVVKTDRREIYINVGEGAGVVEGATLRLKRPMTLRHPVTRAAVTDWLPLGDGTVTDVGGQLARIALPPELLTQVKVGDVAEVYVERAETVAPPPPPPPPPPPDARPIPTVDPDTAEVLTVWRTTTGQSLDARIAAWAGWLADHGDSRYAADVRADLEVLRATREAMRPDAGRPSSANLRVEHLPPTAAEAGRPITLAFVLTDPERVAAASLHARRRGQPHFTRYELVRERGRYLRGVLPAELAIAPGLEYFVEALDVDGDAAAAYGSDVQPAAIAVAAPPVAGRFAPVRRRTQLSISGSYLDFATFDDRTGPDGAAQDRRDTFAEAAVDVLYRLDGLLWGVRLGFGSYGGRGGFADAVWTEATEAPRIGFQFGYVEGELRLPTKGGPPIGLAGRFIAGVGREGFGIGGAARLRLGDPDATNLSVGAGATEQVGFLTDLRLETWPRRNLPVGIAVGVTDQPGNGDLGVRLSADVGYQLRPWVRPTVRGSWQGRSATHAGVGGGLGLVFDW